MRILLDDQPCAVDATTIGEAIDAVAGLAADRGRLIVEVEIDGELWGQGHLDDDGHRGRPADEVRLVSADACELVSQALADADDALESVDGAQQEAARLIEAGESTEAMQQLASALATWESIRRTAVLAARTLDVSMPERIGETLEHKLRLIADALRSKDPIGLSDVLLYEMPAVIEQWREMLDGLRPDHEPASGDMNP